MPRKNKNATDKLNYSLTEFDLIDSIDCFNPSCIFRLLAEGAGRLGPEGHAGRSVAARAGRNISAGSNNMSKQRSQPNKAAVALANAVIANSKRSGAVSPQQNGRTSPPFVIKDGAANPPRWEGSVGAAIEDGFTLLAMCTRP